MQQRQFLTVSGMSTASVIAGCLGSSGGSSGDAESNNDTGGSESRETPQATPEFELRNFKNRGEACGSSTAGSLKMWEEDDGTPYAGGSAAIRVDGPCHTTQFDEVVYDSEADQASIRVLLEEGDETCLSCEGVELFRLSVYVYNRVPEKLTLDVVRPNGEIVTVAEHPE